MGTAKPLFWFVLCALVRHESLSGRSSTAGSTEASLPLEKEEQVRLQARRRLEEQLKQYRVKRQQERVSLLVCVCVRA